MAWSQHDCSTEAGGLASAGRAVGTGWVELPRLWGFGVGCEGSDLIVAKVVLLASWRGQGEGPQGKSPGQTPCSQRSEPRVPDKSSSGSVVQTRGTVTSKEARFSASRASGVT